MNITATLKALPFVSIIAASLMLTPGLSIAGDNSHGQYKRQYNQHGNKMTRQTHTRKTIRHQQQARPHYRRAKKPHYRARAHYSSYQPQYIDNSHAYVVTPVYQPVPVVHTPVITPALTLGLHTGNVTLSLNSH